MSQLRRHRKLFVELLEDRTLLSANYGFEVIGSELYFQVTGSPFDDTIILKTVGSDYSFQVDYTDDTNAPHVMSGTVTAGDIAVAQLFTGKSFAGIKASGDAGDAGADNDFIDATGIQNAHTLLNGNDGDDTIIGSAVNDELNGGVGNDLLLGARGNDLINGEAGDDQIKAGGGNDVAYGGSGDDRIQGDRGADKLYGESGNDHVLADNHDTALSGGTGAETVAPAPLPVTGSYGDVLAFGPTTIGGAVVVNNDFESVFGTTYADVIDSSTFVGGGSFAGKGALVEGNAGADELTGSAYDDTIYGQADDDLVQGKGGADLMDGGTGINTLSYELSNAGVTVNLSTGAASGGHAAGDVFSNFHNLTGSAFPDILTGDDGDNTILGLASGDILSGLMGNDHQEGGAGNDIVDGGIGNDWVAGGLGDDNVNGGIGEDTIFVDYNQSLNLADQAFGGSDQDTFVFIGMHTVIGGVLQLDPVKVSNVEQYMDDLLDMAQSDWDLSLDNPFVYQV